MYTPLHTSHTLVQSNIPNVTELVTFTGTNPHSRSTNYQGKIVVLVNEKTASSAEQYLLFLETVCAKVCGGITYIGTPTNGCVGKITNVKLPGNVFVGMSGVGAKKIDNSPIHGVGITPQVLVEPTIKGIISGVDIVFDKAVEYCTTYLQPPRH